MEWRIRQNSRTNEYEAEYGAKVESQPVGEGIYQATPERIKRLPEFRRKGL